MRAHVHARRCKRAFRALIAVVMFPPALLHELTHALLAAPVAREARVAVSLEGDAATHIEWADDASAYAIAAAYYGPLMLGTAVAAGALVYIGATRTIPQDAWDWLVWAVLGFWWYNYVVGEEVHDIVR